MVAAMLLAACQAPAIAVDFSGNNMADFRSKSPDTFYGYLRGIVDGLTVADTALQNSTPGAWPANAESFRLCLPAGVTIPQVADVTQAFIGNKPKFAHLPLSILVTWAAKEAWPCAKP